MLANPMDFNRDETQMKRILTSACVACLCLFGNTRLVRAEPSATDKSIAAELFEEARMLLQQGRVDQACSKFEESQRLDPGGGTLLNLALCHERQGRTATAWLEFIEARGVANADARPLRVAFAQAHIAQLEPTLSRLVVQVSPAADLPDLEVKRDGSDVGRAAWGSAVPIDPGDHVVEAAAPGKVPWRQSISVASSGDLKTVIIPSLGDVPTATKRNEEPPTDVAVHPAYASDTAAGRGSLERTMSPALTVAAWTTLGLGAVAAGGSAYFGLHALSLKHDADRECPSDACSAQGAADNRDAIRSADLASVAAAVGIAGVGTGVVLLLVSAAHRSPPSVGSAGTTTLLGCDVSGGAGRGELTVRGAW
jgi:hypothetical protein